MNFKEICFFLLAHHSRDDLSHTIRIPLGRRNIYLCARCTSIISSIVVNLFLFTFVINISLIPVLIIGTLAFAFGFPLILSWGKQIVTGQKNINKTRISTGMGGGIAFVLLLFLPTPLRELSIFGTFGVSLIIVVFFKKKVNRED